MKKLKILAAFLCLGLFYACPYESLVPIDQPTIKFDPALLGTWVPAGNSEEVYTVTKKDEYRANISMLYTDTKSEHNCEAWLSVVNGVSFLNMYSVSAAAPVKYSFYKIDKLENGKLMLAQMTEDVIEQFHSSDSLKQFIAANMDKSYFFEKERVTLKRIK